VRRDIADTLTSERRRQNASLLRVYNYYRIIVGISLLVMFLQEVGDRLLGALDPDPFLFTVAAYLAGNLVIAAVTLALPPRFIEARRVGLAIVLLDVVALLLMLHYSGGVTSGLGSLIIVSVALGSIVIAGPASMLLPAFAALGLLYEEVLIALRLDAPAPDFFQAGVLGAIYFGTTLLIRNLSGRLRRLEATNLERALRLRDLERLNREIVQRMQTGILVIDENDGLSLRNEAAQRLLGFDPGAGTDPEAGPEANGSGPARLTAPFRRALDAWRRDPAFRSDPIEAPSGLTLRVNFGAVDPRRTGGGGTILFLEDQAELAQQAQQLKLAALGRLSASIAHEIRNPLGAISHANQLLEESENLDRHDRRLTDIIRTHCARMNEIIENVLQLSRRRAAAPEKLELGPWLQAFLEEFRESGHQDLVAEISVAPEDLAVRMDPRQLGQVVGNLVQNGQRYSRKRTGRPWIAVRGGLDARTERPFLEVIDEGPGVADEQRPHLFEPFHTTEHTGTGLGLYISRELCESNQASLTYNEAETGGSCFRITFPHPDRQTAAIA
jgi:two-component system sensor histidine kinase PilS (NtrC family)